MHTFVTLNGQIKVMNFQLGTAGHSLCHLSKREGGEEVMTVCSRPEDGLRRRLGVNPPLKLMQLKLTMTVTD